jgi:transposase-like protein
METTIKNLKDLFQKFSDEQKCRDFLVQKRWNGCPVCPYCGSDKWYRIENGKRFKCGNKECYKKYSVTVGTVFHASNIPLTTWFPAVYLISANKKGISSVQLSKHLGVSQKTAWFMLHRIRQSLQKKGSSLLNNTVEVDEIYIGGITKNMSNKKRKELKGDSFRVTNKRMVIGMVERNGELRLEVAGKETEKYKIVHVLKDNIDITANLITDSEKAYIQVGKKYKSHQSVNHTVREYVKDNGVHTNTIEGAFGLFRRCIIGTYHKLSPKHLSRYCDEMAFRYNLRNIKDGERFEYTLGRIETPLSWKELTADNGFTAETVIEPNIPPVRLGKERPIQQILNGMVIAEFTSIKDASDKTGFAQSGIGKCARGIFKNCGGYIWKFA